MVLFTVVTKDNPHTVSLQKRLDRPALVRLLSCSFYNNWHNLPVYGSISFNSIKQKRKINDYFLEGHYNVDNIVERLQHISDLHDMQLSFIKNSPHSLFEIHNQSGQTFFIDKKLSKLLGGINRFYHKTYIQNIDTPSSYFINCDLVDDENNFLNGRCSKCLAFFGVKGPCHQQQTYFKKDNNPFIATKPNQTPFIDSFTLSVTDENGSLFDFQGSDLVFEIELK